MSHTPLGRAALVLVLAMTLAACESAYYGTMEKFGYHKRDLLVERVQEAMSAQEDAKQEFQTAYERFASVVHVPPSELRDTYESLDAAFGTAEGEAARVSERIDAVESVSEALFDEWADEIEQIGDSRLRAASARQRSASQREYDELIRAMRRAESRMAPVLDTFRDYVLYLKHNLNAQAIASLRGELSGIETDVSGLIREMEASIALARDFVAGMQSPNS
jgi:hypothetical protein